MSECADQRKTISLAAEGPAQDALLNGFPRDHLTGVAAVGLDAAIRLGDLLARHRNFRGIRGQIIPQFADEKKLLGWRQPAHVWDGLDNDRGIIQFFRQGGKLAEAGSVPGVSGEFRMPLI
jgi:hypothetical protein